MKKIFLILLSLFFSFSYTQEKTLVLNKIDESNFNIDGIISDEEIQGAKVLEILYEESPSFNTVPSKKTTGYLTYSDKFLYVAVKAYRQKVTAPITTRDNGAMWNGDVAGLVFDTYGDARNHINLISNPSGSLFDAIRMPGRGFGSEININIDVNYDFSSMGRITDYGYEMEFIVPFSELPFPNGKDQSWKFKIFTAYNDENDEGVQVRATSSKSNRDASCQLCLLDHTIVMNDIEIEKKLDFLPYVSSNVSGVREKYYDRVNYDTPQLNYGIGFNYELNKNLSIEGTINPDFSQVESDATKIDINSVTALNYPEKRPFF